VVIRFEKRAVGIAQPPLGATARNARISGRNAAPATNQIPQDLTQKNTVRVFTYDSEAKIFDSRMRTFYMQSDVLDSSGIHQEPY
jgi:hypothetical protein